jgi:hypothetical protein
MEVSAGSSEFERVYLRDGYSIDTDYVKIILKNVQNKHAAVRELAYARLPFTERRLEVKEHFGVMRNKASYLLIHFRP